MDSEQKRISVFTNCLGPKANELSTFDVEGKSELGGRNCIDGLHGKCAAIFLLKFQQTSILIRIQSILPYQVENI